MSVRLPRYVHVEKRRHGGRVYYFRAGKGPRIRLPDDPHSAEFTTAVKDAHNGSSYQPPSKRPTFAMVQKQRVGKTLARAVGAARQRARNLGLPFDLDTEWALALAETQGFKCLLTGVPFYMGFEGNAKVDPFTPSIDRIVPQLGYVRSNVRLVIYAVNIMMMDWGQEVFERVINGYAYKKRTKSLSLFPHDGRPMRERMRIVQ